MFAHGTWIVSPVSFFLVYIDTPAIIDGFNPDNWWKETPNILKYLPMV